MSKPVKQEEMSSDHLHTNTSSNQSGSNDFVKKLYQMLQEDSYKDVVRWTKLGDSFVVIDTNEFTKEILPRHFKHSNFASFVRQLNKYDFHKVKVSGEAKRNYEYGDDAWEFKHPEFRMNDREALDNIKRKGTTTKKNGQSNTAGSGSSSVVPDQLVQKVSKLLEQLEFAKRENTTLNHQLNTLNSKYKYLMDYIATIKTYEERNYNSINVLLNSLAQVGIKLPPLDFPNPSVIGSMGYADVNKQPAHSRSRSHPQIRSSEDAQLQIPTNAPTNQSTAVNVNPGLGVNLVPTVNTNEPQSAVHHVPTGQGFNGQAQLKESQSPHSAASNTPPNQPISTTNIANPKFHVLLVEDDNVCIQLCRKFLVKYGCQVTVVTDGLNAISTVEKTKYDLVLMDIVMPNLDGATATSIIRSFDTRTPIIAMTGNIEDNDLFNYLQNGMSDILAKPFTKDDLYSILAKHLLNEAPQGTQLSPANQLASQTPNEQSPALDALMQGAAGSEFLNDVNPVMKKQRLR